MKVIITYLEHTEEAYDEAYPVHGDGEAGPFRGRVCKKLISGASDIESAWRQFMEEMKRDGWLLYSWDAVIKDGIVRHAISAAAFDNPNHSYGFSVPDVITDVAESAERVWWK